MVATTKSDPGSPQGSIEADRRCLLTGLRVLVVEDVGMVATAECQAGLDDDFLERRSCARKLPHRRV
jgi:hypothetical protein